MILRRFAGPLAAAAVLSGVMAAPAFSQSLLAPLAAVTAPAGVTQRFVAAAMPAINFLDASSRMAIDKGASARLRAFAAREAREQTIAGNSMLAWSDVDAPLQTGRSVAVSPNPDAGPLAPVTTLATAPLAVAGSVVDTTAGALTGRSSAVMPALVPLADGTSVLPSQKADLDRLGAATGADFDRLFVATQIDALQQLATLYRDYRATADDPGLRTLVTRELPRVEGRLRELRTL